MYYVTYNFTALGAFMSVRNFAERILTDLAHTWWMVGVAYIGKTNLIFNSCDLRTINNTSFCINNGLILHKIFYSGNSNKLYLGGITSIHCWHNDMGRIRLGTCHGWKFVWIQSISL